MTTKNKTSQLDYTIASMIREGDGATKRQYSNKLGHSVKSKLKAFRNMPVEDFIDDDMWEDFK